MRLIDQFGKSGSLAALIVCFAGMRAEGAGSPKHEEAQRTPTLRTILDVWKSRAERVEAFDFSCAGSAFQSKRLVVALLKIVGTKDGAYAGLSDSLSKARLRFTVDRRQRVRLEYEDQKWSARERNYVPRKVIDLFDGDVREVFFPFGPNEFPNAHISRGSTSKTARNARALPIRLLYRPFGKSMGVVDPQHFVLTEEHEVVDGRSCVILKHSRGKLWVDPARDFVPVRYSNVRQGALDRTIEMAYEHDDQHGWVPKSWKNVSFGQKGEIVDSMTLSVTDFAINKDIPDKLFKNEYPPGTWVHNYITDKEYIVREGGKARPILPGEFDGTNYKELRDSEPGESGQPRGYWMYVVLANIAGLIVVVLVFIYLRRKKTPRSTRDPD